MSQLALKRAGKGEGKARGECWEERIINICLFVYERNPSIRRRPPEFSFGFGFLTVGEKVVLLE